ncbi:hypothetical protein G9A89_001135 [Geosiphon pyriformis]|nr:hypothetical protein G9A89_001135 [Geosiphon pyriformis]
MAPILNPENNYEKENEQDSMIYDSESESSIIDDSESESDTNSDISESDEITEIQEQEILMEFSKDFDKTLHTFQFLEELRTRIQPITNLRYEIKVIEWMIKNQSNFFTDEVVSQEVEVKAAFLLAFPGNLKVHPDRGWRVFEEIFKEVQGLVREVCRVVYDGELCHHSHWCHV